MSDHVIEKAQARDRQKERRERIATAVLAGLFAFNGEWQRQVEAAAKCAARAADALIAELDR